MELTLYQIDAFTNQVFSGNPAAVCPLEVWLPDSTLQAIAEENNLSETAYYVPMGSEFHIRWFTPASEVNLCGHATLAASYVIFELTGHPTNTITFTSRSGELIVHRNHDLLVMDFPSQPPSPCKMPQTLRNSLGKEPIEVLSAEDYMAVYDEQDDILTIKPDFEKLKSLNLRGVIITAKGRNVDFVSRFFAPKFGIDEDPVTGSAHCELTPYWAKKLGKSQLIGKQLSPRGGIVQCELKGDRVLLSGKAVKYMEGQIILPHY